MIHNLRITVTPKYTHIGCHAHYEQPDCMPLLTYLGFEPMGIDVDYPRSSLDILLPKEKDGYLLKGIKSLNSLRPRQPFNLRKKNHGMLELDAKRQIAIINMNTEYFTLRDFSPKLEPEERYRGEAHVDQIDFKKYFLPRFGTNASERLIKPTIKVDIEYLQNLYNVQDMTKELVFKLNESGIYSIDDLACASLNTITKAVYDSKFVSSRSRARVAYTFQVVAQDIWDAYKRQRKNPAAQ